MDFSGLYSLFPEMILFALLLIGVYLNKKKKNKQKNGPLNLFVHTLVLILMSFITNSAFWKM